MFATSKLTGPSQLWLAELQSSLRLGGPLILTNLAQVSLLATNLIYMGRLGPDELAAGSLSASLYQAFMIFSMGLVSAVETPLKWDQLIIVGIGVLEYYLSK